MLTLLLSTMLSISSPASPSPSPELRLTPPTVGLAPPVPMLDPNLPRPIVRKEGTFLPAPSDRAFAAWIVYMGREYPPLCQQSIDGAVAVEQERAKERWPVWKVGLAVGAGGVTGVLLGFLIGAIAS